MFIHHVYVNMHIYLYQAAISYYCHATHVTHNTTHTPHLRTYFSA